MNQFIEGVIAGLLLASMMMMLSVIYALRVHDIALLVDSLYILGAFLVCAAVTGLILVHRQSRHA